MRRVMCLWLPCWPIDRRHGSLPLAPDRPFALALSVGNRRLVTAVNAAAEGLGIAPGLPLTDAWALHPALAVAEADPAGDAAALRRLAHWCHRYSPWTTPHGADAILLDVTGCAHLRGGEASLAHALVERLRRQGIASRAAIAETAGAAWAVARCGGAESAVVPPGEVRAAVAPLPIAALRLDPTQAAELERLGLRRIGALYALPRAALAARFGAGLAERLDQALGAAAEPLSPLPPKPARWVRRRFAEPIGTPEALAAATEELLEGLCRVLGAEMLGARRLVLSCYRVDGAVTQVTVGTARPTRDPRHLFRLFAEQFGTIDPGLGIEDMALAAMAVESLAAAQLRLATAAAVQPAVVAAGIVPFPGDKTVARQVARAVLAAEGRDRDIGDAAVLAALVDRLANRLELSSVGRLEPRQSHVPERAQRLAPAVAVPQGAWRLDPPRPIRLLPRPEPVEAVAPVPDDPPILFRWRRLQHRVRRADGPERLCGEWWRGGTEAAALRDYYRVEDEAGRRFWLYREGLFLPQRAPRWFLHGLFA
ncbi:MAG: DNA polymerase Y family protein [Stellaceae bacterium]